jgi:hypothetical protein
MVASDLPYRRHVKLIDRHVLRSRDADIMDNCELRIYEQIPMGEYVFWRLQQRTCRL